MVAGIKANSGGKRKMGWFTKETRPTTCELSIKEWEVLDSRLTNTILMWVEKEVGDGIQSNTKLFELAVFNFKLIYSEHSNAQELREFFLGPTNVVGESDNIVSRIQDLYLMIKTSFPDDYIDTLREAHRDTVVELGYGVIDQVYRKLPYAWLLDRIQFSIRYLIQAKIPSRKKTSSA